MKLFKLSLVALALVSFAVACGSGSSQNSQPIDMRPNPSPTAAAAKPPTPAATPDELADARSIFKNTCSRCHKEDGTGGTVKLDDGTTLKVPDLHAPHAVKHTDAQLATKIQNGGDGMPRFKDRLDQQKINALVNLIRHDFQAQASPGGVAAPLPAAH
jgi:mono/diheme cytochrome c family protein